MGKDVIIACDFNSKKATFDFLDKFTDEKPFVKIGMELFMRKVRQSCVRSKQGVIKYSLI